MNNRPIGIFDSGIGGLTVLKEYKKLLPHENYIYYADTANLPYGDKSKEQIIEYTKKIVETLIEKNAKAIVIACGTASSLAYAYLKEHYKIPIFNIIEPVAHQLKSKNIGIIATQGSISSNVWQKKILDFNPDCNLTSLACPKLVPIAEQGLINSIESQNTIKEYMKIFKEAKIDSLILGCTHYPLFSDLIQKELGENVDLINVGTYSASEFKNFLSKNNLYNDTKNIGNTEYLVSGNKDIFIKNAKQLDFEIK